MAEIQDINLHIDGQVFSVKKDVLCSHSDYFRAMFSGNYIETEERNITIDVMGADSMNIILRYMDLGFLDLAEYSVHVFCDLAKAANFLQITELIKQIENCFDPELTVSNCMEILDTAEQCSYAKQEHLSAAFGLLSFKSMKPKNVPTIDRLVWYLSHPYLDTDKEIDVFKFGFDWMSQTVTSSDALLIILGCLDVKRLTCNDLYQMCLLIKDHKNHLIEGVINCLEWICMSGDISLDTVTTDRSILCEQFTEQIYRETCNLVKESKERKLKYTPIIQRNNSRESKCLLYKYPEEIGKENCLEIPEKNKWHFCRIVAWGNTKLVCCLHMKPDDEIYVPEPYMTNVMIYDTLRKEWTNHGVKLPPIVGSVAVVDDVLFIVGTCEPRPSTFPTSIAYNLNERTYKRIADSPEGRNYLHLCSHKGSLYAATFPKRLYVYESGRDSWRQLLIHKGLYGRHEINCLISFNDNIYCCSDGHFIQRIRPEIDDSWELVSFCRKDVYISTISMCSLRSRLLVFLKKGISSELEINSVSDINVNYEHRFLFHPQITYMSIASSCLLVLDLPSSLHTETSKYHKKYLTQLHLNCHSTARVADTNASQLPVNC